MKKQNFLGPPKHNIKGLWLVFAFILSYMLIDFVRRFFDGVSGFLVVVDVFVLFLSVSFFIRYFHVFLEVFRRFKLYYITFIPYACFIVSYGLIKTLSVLDTPLLSIRSYLFPHMLLPVGFCVGKIISLRKAYVFERFLVGCLIVSIGFAIFQLVYDSSHLTGVAMSLFLPMEHAAHSFGTEMVDLHSSFFASSKRFGRFVVVVSILVAIIRNFLGLNIGMIPFLAFLGSAVSGSREAFFISAAFLIGTSFQRIRRRFILWSFLLPIIGIVLYWIFAFYFDPNDDVFFKILFLISDFEEISSRLSMFFPILFPVTLDWYYIFGFGPGTYGQEVLGNSYLFSIAEDYGLHRFQKLPFFESDYHFLDSGLTKINLEIGLLGVMLWTVIHIFMASGMFRLNRRSNTSLRLFYPVFLLVSFILFSLKGHPVLSDLGFVGLIYFTMGLFSGFACRPQSSV